MAAPLHRASPGQWRQVAATRIHDMDDTLEQPRHSPNLNTRDEDCEQDSSGDEDGGLDWTKLPYVHLPLNRLVP